MTVAVQHVMNFANENQKEVLICFEEDRLLDYLVIR
ncbi:hypothetical protein QFZ28_005738 [Neobacillus niacini]|nr:hypothetical protein [Neobacillus niacini]